MVKILMHGCNGKMGRMITEIVKNEEDAVIAARCRQVHRNSK